MAKKEMKKALTKTQLISHLAEKTEIPKKKVVELMEELLGTAYREAKKDYGFTIGGLGKLVVVKRKARKGRNPQTGAVIDIPAKRALKFRIAKQAKDAVLGAAKK